MRFNMVDRFMMYSCDVGKVYVLNRCRFLLPRLPRIRRTFGRKHCGRRSTIFRIEIIPLYPDFQEFEDLLG